MTKIDVAKAVYEKVGRHDFEEDVWNHLKNWFVISNPWAFLTARVETLEDGQLSWRITNAVGQLSMLATMLPFRLPYVTFQRSKRGDREHRIRFDRAKELIGKIKNNE